MSSTPNRAQIIRAMRLPSVQLLTRSVFTPLAKSLRLAESRGNALAGSDQKGRDNGDAVLRDRSCWKRMRRRSASWLVVCCASRVMPSACLICASTASNAFWASLRVAASSGASLVPAAGAGPSWSRRALAASRLGESELETFCALPATSPAWPRKSSITESVMLSSFMPFSIWSSWPRRSPICLPGSSSCACAKAATETVKRRAVKKILRVRMRGSSKAGRGRSIRGLCDTLGERRVRRPLCGVAAFAAGGAAAILPPPGPDRKQTMRKKLVAGNWKMHGSRSMADSLVRQIVEDLPDGVDVLVIPPAIYLADLVHEYGDRGLGFGAQTISEHPEQGAYTGEISGSMVRDVGAKWTLVGHSERRQYYHETDALLSKKFRTACDAGLTPIYCVGETQEEHEAGKAEEVIGRQLAAVIDVYGVEAFRTGEIAYEPVWAIGTGLTATPDKVQKIHAFIRSQVAKKDVNISLLTRVLYGGSVKPANAADLFAQPDVDGGLIGGAALVASDFLEICAAARR